MRRLRQFAATLAALMLVVYVCAAADTKLELHGRVTDENGLPVGDAQVKLELLNRLEGRPLQTPGQPPAQSGDGRPTPSSEGPPSQPGGRGALPPGGQVPTQPSGPTFTAVSDDAGFFTLPNLSPGQYTVTVQKPGYFVLANQKIELTAGNTEFGFTLNHVEEVREKVDVTVSEDRIDPTSTPSTASLTDTEIRDIPVPSSHDLQQSLVAMPQVLRDNSNLPHVAGARTTQTLHLLDGVDVTDPTSGAITAQMIVESVRKAEIQTSRFGAEYAHPGAAILSYDTREGDDRWRFGTTDFIPGIKVQEGLQFGNFYPRVEFSGPIVKEHFWFSQAFDLVHTLSIVNGLPSGQNERSEWGGDSWSRLLWKISTNNSLHIAFLYNNRSDSNFGLDALHPISTTSDTSSNTLFGFVKAQSYAHKTLFEYGIGVERNYGDSNPMGDAPYILLVNGAEGNYFQQAEQMGRRYQAFTDAISSPLHWVGTHTLSAGANLSSVELISYDDRGEIQALRSDLTLERLTTFAGYPRFSLSNTLAGGFVQDQWAPNKYVVAQVGVRADWDRLFQAALVEPRVELNFLPFSGDRTKFSIGWGMYNIPLNLSLIGQTYDQWQVDTLYNATGTTPVDGPAASFFLRPPGGLPSLEQPYFDIASAGWQQRFGENTLVSLELLARDGHHELVYETESPGSIGSNFLLQTTRRDKYRAATISARHTFSNGTILFGSYTRSKANTDQDLDPMLGQLYFAPQQPGPLSWDAPNRLLTWGSVPTPIWGILFTYFFEYRTGYPYSVINQQQFLVGPPNSQRFPDYRSLTIAVEKKFGFSHRVFAVRVAVVNILGRQNPDVVVNNIDAPNFGAFSGGQGRAVTARLRFVGRH